MIEILQNDLGGPSISKVLFLLIKYKWNLNLLKDKCYVDDENQKILNPKKVN